MGEHAALTALEWQITREAQDELAVASHHHLAASYDRGFQDDLITPFNGARARPEPARRLLDREAREAQAGLRQGRGGHDDRRELDPADRRRLRRCCWPPRSGPRSTACPVQAYFVDAETAAVDFVHGGEGLLMAPAYAVPRMLERNGLTLQDFDYYEIHEAFASQVLSTLNAWEDPVFCKERLGLDAPLGSIDRSQAERQRLLARRGPPVRRDRRPDRRQPREAAQREGLGPRPDLDLRRRWPGRHGDPREVAAALASYEGRGPFEASDSYDACAH